MAEGHRADGPAVDAGGDDAGEETAVEAVVTAVHRLPAKCRVQLQVPAGGIGRHACPGVMYGEVHGQNRIRETLLDL